nr:pyruvate kinase [Burkholderia cepacia]
MRCSRQPDVPARLVRHSREAASNVRFAVRNIAAAIRFGHHITQRSQHVHRGTEQTAASAVRRRLWPSSSGDAAIGDMTCAGAGVPRLNFSHGTHDDHVARHTAIRTAEVRLCRPIGILIDL